MWVSYHVQETYKEMYPLKNIIWTYIYVFFNGCLYVKFNNEFIVRHIDTQSSKSVN